MSRTIVITGGTNGIGKALARHHAERGDLVIAVGSGEAGGERLRRDVPSARFVRADLSSVRQTRDLIERLRDDHPVIDALVLGAFRYNRERVETEEGFEHTFALYVINRWLMAEGLREPLERAPAPVIVDLCGVGGIRAGRIRWDDPQLTRGYRPFRATMQGARGRELLASTYAAERTSYVLYNPMFVATGLFEPFRQPVRGLVRVTSALFAQPVARAVPPIAALIDSPPAGPLTACRRGRPIAFAVDRDQALRFEKLVRATVAPFSG
ncbi:SDR family NAD(P)-dependent oxidoreductase [Streptosporangium sp. NPDC002721]|uniref:SDR family NAD(P)-dependent oxidoreductase n=1 Tax=Streptosporangium sp. NPDC002721 TaxID=3366188 RepID=UPI00368095FB